MCMRVVDTSSTTMPAYCIAANYNNSQATQSITTDARVAAESTRCEAKMAGQIYTIQTSWPFCCTSVTPICVVSTSLSAIS